jgi:hypothetical protein
VTELRSMANEWRAWSAHADRSESGWQSDFPDWQAFVSAACQVMTQPLDAQSIQDVELVWHASEEGEELVDFSRGALDRVHAWLTVLARSSSAAVRWQVYEALRAGVGKPWAERMLRAGLQDNDAYARRRAALALAPYRVADAADIVDILMQEEDPYLRQAAVVIASESRDPQLIERIHARVRNDPNDHVRATGSRLLS